jgi:hypothetical protein
LPSGRLKVTLVPMGFLQNDFWLAGRHFGRAVCRKQSRDLSFRGDAKASNYGAPLRP